MVSILLSNQLIQKQMNKKYKFITIKYWKILDSHKTYSIVNNKSMEKLGILYWHKPWKQYVFTQWERGTIFNDDCLKNIIDYLSIINK